MECVSVRADPATLDYCRAVILFEGKSEGTRARVPRFEGIPGKVHWRRRNKCWVARRPCGSRRRYRPLYAEADDCCLETREQALKWCDGERDHEGHGEDASDGDAESSASSRSDGEAQGSSAPHTEAGADTQTTTTPTEATPVKTSTPATPGSGDTESPETPVAEISDGGRGSSRPRAPACKKVQSGLDSFFRKI